MASPALRRTGQVLTGMAALIGLLALLFGAPAALAVLGGNPLPDHLPSWAETTSALLRPDDSGQLFIAAITIVGWIAWVAFAVPVVVEAFARLRGVRTPRLPGLGAPQQVAAGLLGAIALMFASPAIAATTPAYAALPPAAVQATAAFTPTHVAHTVTEHAAQPGGHTQIAHQAPIEVAPKAGAPQEQERPVSYRVDKDDHLSGISQRLLGDADRYTELAKLNAERITDPDHIEPGWELKLPKRAKDRGAQHHASGEVIERPAQKAAQTPADAGDTQAPAPDTDAADPQAPAPDTDAADPQPEAATPEPNTATPPGAVTPGPGGIAEQPAQQPASPAASTQPTAEATPPAPAPAASGAADDRKDAAGADDALDGAVAPVAVALGGAGVLAALALVALRRRRARQQQHRRPRRRIAKPVTVGAEAKLRVAAAPTDLERLDAALRVLAAGLNKWPDEQWPDVVAAWVDRSAIHLVLTEACTAAPPAPWLSAGETLWTLPAHLDLSAEVDHLAPLPTLVALGSQSDQHLMVDLERLGRLTVTGDAERALDLLRYVGAELAHNRWSDDVQVTLAGFPPDEAQLLAQLNTARVSVAASVQDAVTRMRRQLDDTRAALGAAGALTTVQGRVGDHGDAWTPQVLLVAEPVDHEVPLLAELEQELTATPSSGFAVVVAGGSAEPGRWSIEVDNDGQLHVSFLTDSALTASGLPVALLAPLADLMQTADRTDDEPTPPAPDIEEWAYGTDAAGGLHDGGMHDMFGIDDDAVEDEPTDRPLVDEQLAAPDDEQDDDHDAAVDGADHTEGAGADDEDDEVDPPADDRSPTAMPIRITVRSGPSAPVRRDAASASVLLPLRPTSQPAADPVIAAKIRQDREQRDPHLDADVAAWFGSDPARPRIGILGPVQVETPGPALKNRQRFYSEIVVYLAARGARGATAAQLEDAIWREREASSSTRRSAVSHTRTWLGDRPDGGAWMPRMGADQLYRIDEGFLFDWSLFRRLRARGEARGAGGAGDLRRALELVRSAPFDGVYDAYTADRTAYAWLPDSEIAPTHLVAAVVDTAHALVELCLAVDDIAGARWALERAWLADPDRYEDQPWRDAMRIAHADGRDSEFKALLQELRRLREADCNEELDPETYQLVKKLMPYPQRAAS